MKTIARLIVSSVNALSICIEIVIIILCAVVEFIFCLLGLIVVIPIGIAALILTGRNPHAKRQRRYLPHSQSKGVGSKLRAYFRQKSEVQI